MEKQSYERIPMLERWKNDIPVGKTVGFRGISNEERISARKRSLERRLKHGKITQEQVDRSLESLYKELNISVAK